MKSFEVPEVEVVRFGQNSILTTSTGDCDDCGVCPPGKNDCTCYDFTHQYSPVNELP